MPPDPALAGAVTIDDVRRAASVLDARANRTPVMTSRRLDELAGGRVHLKCENFQRVGAFKFRGAFNALARLEPEARRQGVLAYSSGNHAQAVALAGAELGVAAVIVMPDNAPGVKLRATRAYLEAAPAGSAVVTYDPATTVREELGARIAGERGLTIIPPYDHPDVIAGQGTAALELFEAVGELDWLFVCCGGGGLLSGCATVARAVCPGCRVVGVEPELGDDATRSFAAGTLQTVTNPATIADGARTPCLGRYTFAIVRERVDQMVVVSEGELARWTLFCLERLRMVVEPSGALGLAGAVRVGRSDPRAISGRRVGVIVSGGNLDLGMIDELRRLAGE